jgi:hypothetical protein
MVFAGLAGVCAAGLLATSVGCGGSDNNSSTGKGGSGGSTTGKGGSTGSGQGGSGSGQGGSTGSGQGGSGSGQGGSTGVQTVDFTFDSSDQGWTLNTYDEPANLARKPAATDGGTDAAVTDAGATAPVPVLAFDSAVGSPSPGSLKLTATWTANGQYAEAIFGYAAPGMDLTGRTLHAKIMVDSTSSTFPGGVSIFVDSTASYTFVNATGVSLGAAAVGTWTDVSIVLDPTVYSMLTPGQIVQIGLHFYTENPPATPATYPVQTVFHIDTVVD